MTCAILAGTCLIDALKKSAKSINSIVPIVVQ